MSKDFDDRNRGQVWKNEKKSSDKHPDFTGSLNVDGKGILGVRLETEGRRQPAFPCPVLRSQAQGRPRAQA